MATNQFLPFAQDVGANVMLQAAWQALAARTAGFATGEADSSACNKAWRQAMVASQVLASIIVQNGVDALDDGDNTTFKNNLLDALSALLTPRLPAGMIMPYAAPTGTPTGRWVYCNGAVVARAGTYAGLYAAIGTSYNTGGESGSQFRLPDSRALVLRGLDDGRGIDTGRAMGPAYQADQNKSHYHLLPQVGDGSCINQYLYGQTDISPTQIATLDNKSANTSDAARTSAGAESGGGEVRVKNMAVRFFISY